MLIFIRISFILMVVIPIVVSVCYHVMLRAADKISFSNNIGNTYYSLDDVSYDLKYTSTSRLHTPEDCRKYLKEYGGDIYEGAEIRVNDILTDDYIPDELPDVDIPLFKPKT